MDDTTMLLRTDILDSSSIEKSNAEEQKALDVKPNGVADKSKQQGSTTITAAAAQPALRQDESITPAPVVELTNAAPAAASIVQQPQHPKGVETGKTDQQPKLNQSKPAAVQQRGLDLNLALNIGSSRLSIGGNTQPRRLVDKDEKKSRATPEAAGPSGSAKHGHGILRAAGTVSPQRKAMKSAVLSSSSSSVSLNSAARRKSTPKPATKSLYDAILERRHNLDKPFKDDDLVYVDGHGGGSGGARVRVEDIVAEVYDRSGEGWAKWDKQWNAAGTNAKFEVDYIVGTRRRKYTNARAPSYVLVKWTKYPVPTWMPVGEELSGLPMEDFMVRLACGDLIECLLREELGDVEFDRLFPSRYLEHKKDFQEGKGRYVKDRLSLYHNRLRAIEAQINRLCDLAGRPHLYIFDWTDSEGKEDDLTLKKWNFSLEMQPDDEVKKLLKDYLLATDIKCDGSCTGACQHTANAAGKEQCCGLNSKICYDHYGNASFGRPKKEDVEQNLFYECTPDCHENDEDGKSSKCCNTEVQKDRAQTMVIFRDPIKGWTLRSTMEMEKAHYVTYYAGKVQMAASEAKEDATYDFALSHSLRLTTGEEIEPLVICSSRTGNESRFMSHGCYPNTAPVMVCVTRHGKWYSYPTFRATKGIRAGEEFSFDYYKGDKHANTWDHHFETCSCAHPKCRYTEDVETRKAKWEMVMEKEKRRASEMEERRKRKEQKEQKKMEERREKKERKRKAAIATVDTADEEGRRHPKKISRLTEKDEENQENDEEGEKEIQPSVNISRPDEEEGENQGNGEEGEKEIEKRREKETEETSEMENGE